MIELLLALLLSVSLGARPQTATSPGPVSGAAAKANPSGSDLNRIAAAVEGAESSHGRDPLMWRPDRHSPQGPMQVTHAASLDVGTGNRFDITENRQIGRAYLAVLFRRYGNWADTAAAYNWGPGNLDRWIAAGRPASGLSLPIQAYVDRILREFGAGRAISAAASTAASTVARPTAPLADPPPPEIRDPALKQAYERNAALIKQIRDSVGGDDGAESAVRAAVRTISGRRGYAEFRRLRLSGPHAASAAVRSVANVLLAKLRAENAAIILVDERRGGKRGRM